MGKRREAGKRREEVREERKDSHRELPSCPEHSGFFPAFHSHSSPVGFLLPPIYKRKMTSLSTTPRRQHAKIGLYISSQDLSA